MLSRREVLIRGAGLASLPLLSRGVLGCTCGAGAAEPLAAPARLAPQGPPLYKVIVDRRFPISRAFAAAAARAGTAVLAICGDVTDVWYDDLAPAWRRQPVPIAGLTAEAAIFCLERLSWDVGMRVSFRGVHTAQVAGGWAHELEGPEPVLESLRRAWRPDADWARELGRVARWCTAPNETPPGRLRALATPSLTARFDQWRDDRRAIPLISWVIAPQRRSGARAST